MGLFDDWDPLGKVLAGVGCIAAAPLVVTAATGIAAVGGAVGVTAGMLSTGSAISGGAAAATAAEGVATTIGSGLIAKGVSEIIE